MAQHENAASDVLAEQGRREYFRVQSRLALRTRELPPEEADRLRLTIAERKPREEPKIDPYLRIWLERLENKVDQIRAHLDPEAERPLGVADLQTVEISGSGLAWHGAPLYPEAAWIRADFEIPGPHPLHVIVLGRAVARHPQQDGEETQAIAFEAIYEGDRDAIVRHCLDTERRTIQIESGRPS